MVIIPITEPVLSVDEFDNPKIYKNAEAVMVLLTRLILLNPGTIQSHPDMGVGIVKYRYSTNTLDKLQERVANQIDTYLPFYQNVSVSIILTPDKICNIEIGIGDTVYIYDSKAFKPITLTDIRA